MKILVLNCGSSSLKYQVLDMENEKVYNLLAKGLVERIGNASAGVEHKLPSGEKFKAEMPIYNHTEAIGKVLSLLTDEKYGVVASLSELDAVGHRLVHGGEDFAQSVEITDEVVAKVEECCDLAPLHNPANLLGIKAVTELMPDKPQVGVFDTSFHQTMPPHAFLYSIPYDYYDKYKVRRYGFHGSSHKFVSQKAAEFLGFDIKKSKIITCHLGNGSSISAVLNGHSVDTSMGLTPVEGVTMGTRCGNVDAGVITFLMDKEHLDTAGINAVLNKKSGLLGISGLSSDNRDIDSGIAAGNRRAQLAHDKVVYDVKKYIGAYAAVMDGVDVIVFTGGIGENACNIRQEICEGLGYLGVEFDRSANDEVRGVDVLLTKPSSKVKVVALTTNEELVIARDTMEIVNKKASREAEAGIEI